DTEEELQDTKDNWRGADQGAKTVLRHVNSLTPALIEGLQSKNIKVKESVASFMYSNGELLDPVVLRQVGPSLVNVLEEQADKPSQIAYYAQRALERMATTAAASGDKDALAAIELKLRQAKSAAAKETLSAVRREMANLAARAPVPIR